MKLAPKPPLARMGQKLADQGRYGDTMLVHMNPYEVQGLAAMSPTGQLTRNPETGQPEAFLPFLAPLLGKAIGTKLLAGKLGAGLAGAIGSGLGTFAESGSLEKGLVSGITGFGLGKIFSAGADAVNAGTEMASLTSAQEGLQTAMKGAELTPDMLEASKILQQPNAMVNAATMGEALATPVTAPVDVAAEQLIDPFAGARVPSEMPVGFTPISEQAQGVLDASQRVGSATSALDSARQGITFGDRLSAFTKPEGLRAMGKAALQPENLLTTGLGLGQRAAIEQQENMQRIADEQAAQDEAYAQGFRNVLTDALGMARGTNPNPYANRYASGGVVKMDSGGELDDSGEGDSGVSYTAEEEAGIAGYGLDNDKRYFITPAKGSAAERQSFLRGFEKQDPPTDYRHGFEQEYQFFDFIKDRPIDRYLDTFGSGPSDYLAGLLAVDQGTLDELGTPTAIGTKPLAEYTTTKGQQFSGVDNFSDMGVTRLPPIAPPVTTPETPVMLPPVVPPVIDPVVPPVVPPPPDPTFMDAVRGLGIEVDQDYVRPEGRMVYDVLEDFDAFGKEDVKQLADYFGVTEEFAQDNIDIIRQNRETRELLDKALEGGIEQVDPGEEAKDAYTEGEKDAVFNLINTGQLSIPAAAEYFQIPVDEVTAAYESMLSPASASDTPASASDTPASDSSSVSDQAADTAYSDILDIQDNLNIDDDILSAIERGEIDLAEMGQMFAKGGKTGKKSFMTKAGMVHLANGGIAEAIPEDQPEPEMMAPPVEEMSVEMMFDDGMGGIDHEALVSATIEAIKGTVDNADQIIELFIEEYGVDNFRVLRERVLQSIVPNAQTEGRIEGSGGGMDDEVMGMIGENQPVAVSPDEYIVAADVVSGLGDGSSEAGADILDQVQENVRAARTGGRQPAPINLSRVLPA